MLLLLEDYPEGALVADADGRLPMHWAAEGSPENVGRMLKADQEAMLEMVKALHQAHPDAVRLQDHDGLLPLHCAAFSPGQV